MNFLVILSTKFFFILFQNRDWSVSVTYVQNRLLCFSISIEKKRNAVIFFFESLEIEKIAHITSHATRTTLVALLELVALVALVALMTLVIYTCKEIVQTSELDMYFLELLPTIFYYLKNILTVDILIQSMFY